MKQEPKHMETVEEAAVVSDDEWAKLNNGFLRLCDKSKGPDFEVMYRAEHLKALQLEMQLLNIRFNQCQDEVTGIEAKAV